MVLKLLLVPAAAVLGGLCWVLRWLGTGPVEALHWAGLVLLGLALAGVGAGLVSRSATWLRLLVAVALPLLAWSVYVVVRGESEAVGLDGMLGTMAVLAGAAALVVVRRRAGARAPRGRRVR